MVTGYESITASSDVSIGLSLRRRMSILLLRMRDSAPT